MREPFDCAFVAVARCRVCTATTNRSYPLNEVVFLQSEKPPGSDRVERSPPPLAVSARRGGSQASPDNNSNGGGGGDGGGGGEKRSASPAPSNHSVESTTAVAANCANKTSPTASDPLTTAGRFMSRGIFESFVAGEYPMRNLPARKGSPDLHQTPVLNSVKVRITNLTRV